MGGIQNMIYVMFLLLSGILQGLMLSLNGQLGNYYSMFGISFFVHSIAMVLLILYIKCKEKKKIRLTGFPKYIYLVGFMGIGMVTSSSWCTLAIGATAMTALSVVGQMVSSALVDHYGWFGMEVEKFDWRELPAYILVLFGVWLVSMP